MRGNYSLQNPKTLTDALTVDLIGMKAGMEIFTRLQTAIWLKDNKSNSLSDNEIRYLIGGSHYFKIKAIK